jgi:uncharacterized NAD-dependent epimerase/dehydratase family protein
MKSPYLLFLGAETSIENAKTAAGIAHWRSELCIGQARMTAGTVDLGLADLDVKTAASQGAKTLIIGVAPFGGKIEQSWVPIIIAALENGLDIAAGLHQRLSDHPDISEVAKAHGRQLHDVRQPTTQFTVASGEKRSGQRLLTVGTDCAVGKKYTALAIEKEMRARGLKADYRATGQTGVFIAGGGFSIDAVISDFLSGAVETLSPNNDNDHWDVIEGQGSLYHPSYAAVTVGLIHGSQADQLVLCHEAGRETIDDVVGYPILELQACMDGYLAIAKLTNKNVSFAGISVNTSKLSASEAQEYLNAIEQKYGLPCCDPVRTGVASIVDQLGV